MGKFGEGEYGDFSCLVGPLNLDGQVGWVGANHIFLVGANHLSVWLCGWGEPKFMFGCLVGLNGSAQFHVWLLVFSSGSSSTSVVRLR